jgi:hypothetical protein
VLLQHAEQLHLGLDRELPDLVQEDGAAVGELEAPDAPLERAGEGALDVAEELALDETGRHGAAVDLHEGARAARTGVVDGPRNQLLASPGLARDEHGGIGRRHFLHASHYRQQRLAGAHHLGKVVLAVDLLLQVGVLALQTGLEPGDLLVGGHVLDGDGHLAGHLLQEGDVGVGIGADPRAGHGQRADAAGPRDERHDRERAHAAGERLGLGRVLRLPRQVAAHEGTPLLEYQADVTLGGRDLQPHDEVRRRQRGLQHEQAQDVPLRIVQEGGGPLEGHDSSERARDGGEQRLPSHVGDEGVRDLEQRAIPLGVGGRPSRAALAHERGLPIGAYSTRRPNLAVSPGWEFTPKLQIRWTTAAEHRTGAEV